MARINVVTGRGGAGKSTFTAFFARYINIKRLLLIDLDPDGSLARMLGIDLEEEGRLTVSEALYDGMGKGKDSEGIPELLMKSLEEGKIIHRDRKFHLITLGTKLAPGCYCLPDEMIKEMIRTLQKDYDMILVDSPAGLEHLNRKVTPHIDDLFVILDPSEKSMKHIERIKYVAKGVRITYRNFYLVGNHRFRDDSESYLMDSGEKYLGRLSFDQMVREVNLKGESLLQISDDSPYSISVRKVIMEAGYDLVS